MGVLYLRTIMKHKILCLTYRMLQVIRTTTHEENALAKLENT